MDRTRLHNGQLLYLYRAPRRPTPIRPCMDAGHIPDVAGAETVPESEGSTLRAALLAAVLSLPLWWLAIYLLHRVTGLMPVS